MATRTGGAGIVGVGTATTARGRCSATRIQGAVGRAVIGHIRVKTIAIRTHSMPARTVLGAIGAGSRAAGINRASGAGIAGWIRGTTNASRAIKILGGTAGCGYAAFVGTGHAKINTRKQTGIR